MRANRKPRHVDKRRKDISSRMTVIDVFSRITVIDNKMWLKYSLCKHCVDPCNDISRIAVVDKEIWSKYSLRRCLINGVYQPERRRM